MYTVLKLFQFHWSALIYDHFEILEMSDNQRDAKAGEYAYLLTLQEYESLVSGE